MGWANVLLNNSGVWVGKVQAWTRQLIPVTSANGAPGWKKPPQSGAALVVFEIVYLDPICAKILSFASPMVKLPGF